MKVRKFLISIPEDSPAYAMADSIIGQYKVMIQLAGVTIEEITRFRTVEGTRGKEHG